MSNFNKKFSKITTNYRTNEVNPFSENQIVIGHQQFEDFRETCKNQATQELQFNHVWKLLISPFNLIRAYNKIKKRQNFRNMTINDKNYYIFLNEIRNNLLRNSYEPKKNLHEFSGKSISEEKYLLSIPNFRDRIIQAAIRNILECIFEPRFQFLEKKTNYIVKNYGFQSTKRQHEAIKELKFSLPYYAHAIELHCIDSFTKVSHKHVIKKIERRLKDKKVLELVERIIKSDILYMKKEPIPFNETLNGAVLGPILWNIFFELFDNFIRTDLHKYINNINIKEHRNNGNTSTFNVSKFKVFRFADDILILHDGPKRELPILMDKTCRFLKTLNLTVSHKQREIKKRNDVNNPIKFIGFQLLVCKRMNKHNQKFCSVRPDVKQVLTKLNGRGYSDKIGHPRRNNFLFMKSNFEIISHFKLIISSCLNYFTPAVSDVAFLYRIRYILRFSCAMTLASKHKSSITKIFKKHSRQLNCSTQINFRNPQREKTEIKTITVNIPNRKRLIEHSKNNGTNILSNMEINPFSDSINFLTRHNVINNCSYCALQSSNERFKYYNVNNPKISNLKEVQKFRDTNQDKRLLLCQKCYYKAKKNSLNYIK